jgi:multimeric flavodoxin WrbA
MKVTAFNGSARKDGNTSILINTLFAELQKEGIETELVSLAEKEVKGCVACYQCWNNKDRRCGVDDDDINELVDKMIASEGIILASPTYFSDVTTEMKALIDRAGMTAMGNGGMFKRKVGAAVVVHRRGGAIHTFDTINHFFLISQMIIPGSAYWNFGVGREIGDVKQDEEGLNTMRLLGENMAWLLRKLHG